MADFKVSHRYATSLIESAIEKNKLDKTTADLMLLKETLEVSRDLQLMLESPVIKPDLKKKILNEIFSTKIDNETMNFINFVVDKRREQILHSIAARFLELRDEYLGIASADVITAYQFTDQQKEILKSRLEKILNKKVKLNFTIDNKLIGGFIAKIGDTLYDASMLHQLELLRKQFATDGISIN
jgi:F-type H+-transporting ATPase subunit delta